MPTSASLHLGRLITMGGHLMRAKPDPTHPDTGRIRAFYELTKPGITGYVMVTAGASAYVGSGGGLELTTAVHTILGTGVATGGALSLNQYVEREIDAVMERTRQRPIPSGRVTPMEALAFGSVLLMGGLVYLAGFVGALPAALAAASAIVYHGVYTPLKTRSYAATLAGSVPGALPMLIGWTAATGTVGSGGLALFAIGYLWQLPHVLGLAWMLREDYARVGFKLIPDGGARQVGRQMVLATGLLVPMSWTPTLLGLTGWVYLAGATVLGLIFLWRAVQAAQDLTEQAARRVFFMSLLYHPPLLGLMVFDTALSI
jgi:protoheme IX farnesyltransferase